MKKLRTFLLILFTLIALIYLNVVIPHTKNIQADTENVTPTPTDIPATPTLTPSPTLTEVNGAYNIRESVTVRCDNPTTALVEIRVTNNESFPIIAKAENSLFSLVVSSAWIQPGVTAYSGYGLNQSTTIGGGDVKFTITKTDDSNPYTFYVTFPEISCDPSSTISPTVSLTETPTVSPTVSPTETVTPTDNPGNSDSSDSNSCSNCGGNNININVEQQQQQQQVLAATVAPAPSTKQLPSTGAQDVAIIPTLLSLVAAGWKLRKLA